MTLEVQIPPSSDSSINNSIILKDILLKKDNCFNIYSKNIIYLICHSIHIYYSVYLHFLVKVWCITNIYMIDEWQNSSLNTLNTLCTHFLCSTCIVIHAKKCGITLKHLWALLEATDLYIKLASNSVPMQPLPPHTDTAILMSWKA